MAQGKVITIIQDSSLVCIKHIDDNYTIAQYYETDDIEVNDIIDAERILGDVLVKNKTKDKYVQIKIRYIGLTEKKMKKVLEL